jgi:hypothetical protein
MVGRKEHVWLKRWGKCYDLWGQRPSANRARAHGWGSNPRFQNRFTGPASQPAKPTWTRNQNRTSKGEVGGKGGMGNGGGTMVRGKWNPDGCRKAITTPSCFPCSSLLCCCIVSPALSMLKFLICD